MTETNTQRRIRHAEVSLNTELKQSQNIHQFKVHYKQKVLSQ